MLVAACTAGARVVATAVRPASEAAAAGRAVTGGTTTYDTRPGDSISLVGARFGESPFLIARRNGLPWNRRLRVGDRLTIDNRHIVPGGVDEGIVVNIPQRMLFLLRQGRAEAAYPVAVGKPTWETPTGQFTIGARDRDPTWIVPEAIQEEMRERGEPVLTEVPPGPDNPLGAYRLRLRGTDYAIHGTNAPASIFSYGTHGCIRLGPPDIAALFDRVSIGEPVSLIYAPALLAVGPGGEIYLEVHRDVYNKRFDPRAVIGRAAAALGVGDRLDADRVKDVLAARDGIARRVDRPESSPGRE
ncbi:MAG: L,D-transpeptidase family protein [Acidobacteriota bacterium]|nr:L,D-transpeptidase family protein [Acidobacteriota bacterium]